MTAAEPGFCYHCGLPVASDSDYWVSIDGADRPMCCPGCQSAAETILSLGLGEYYRQRTAAAPASAADRLQLLAGYSAWNDPQLQEQFSVANADGSRSIDLLIEGMNCVACGWLLERSLQSLDGVNDVCSSLPEKRVSLRWNPQQASLADLLAQVLLTGYPARPWNEDARRDSERREEKSLLIGIGIAGIGMMQVMMYALAQYTSGVQGVAPDMLQLLRWSGLILSTPVVLVAASPFFSSAYTALRAGRLSMEVPVALALGLAWSSSALATFTGRGEVWFDSVCMFVFFLLCGRFLELRARRRAHAGNYHSPLPDVAWLDEPEGPRAVPALSLQAGDRILVRAGEAVPADGSITQGSSALVESLLTGEHLPQERSPGDRVYAGTLNCNGTLHIEVQHAGLQTRAAALETLTQQSQRVTGGRLADRVATWFTPAVLLAAGSTWTAWQFIDPAQAFPTLLAVLVITCPCALSLATPAALAAATNALRPLGVLVRDGSAIENLADITHVAFDKTGTLTTITARIAQSVIVGKWDETTCRALAARMEQISLHPYASAFTHGEHPVVPVAEELSAIEEITGGGIQANWGTQTLRLGGVHFAALEIPHQPEPPTQNGSWLLLAHGQQVLAWFQIENPLHPDARQCIEDMRELGAVPLILSGDQPAAVEAVALACQVDEWHARQEPEQKACRLDQLREQGQRVLMIGDGLNDAPGLRHALVSIAIDSGADLTRASADIVLLGHQLKSLPIAMRHAVRVRSIVRQNLTWALAYNILALPAAAAGWMPPWMAALGMSLSSLLVTVNAMRLSRVKPTTGDPIAGSSQLAALN